jgi:hypothetical protein
VLQEEEEEHLRGRPRTRPRRRLRRINRSPMRRMEKKQLQQVLSNWRKEFL